MCFRFLFSLPVLVAVAWRVCMIKRTKQTKKNAWKNSAQSDPNNKRERGLFLVGGVYVLVCVPSRFCCEYVFVAVAVTVRLRSSSILWAPGAWIGLCVCLCFCLKRALFLSLSFGSLTLSLSLAIVLPSYLHWSPPQFDYFYQKVLSFFLLCVFASFNL